MILLTADIHAHNFTDFNSPTKKGRNSRLMAIMGAMQRMLDYGNKHDAKDFVIIGDLFHSQTKIDVDVVSEVSSMLYDIKGCGIDVTIICGNHDQYLRDGSCNSVSQFRGIANVVTEPKIVHLNDAILFAVPYIDDQEKLQDALDQMALHAKGIKENTTILGAHLAVDGSFVGSFEYQVKTHVGLKNLHTSAYSLVFLGHHHKPQELDEGVYYVGSPVQHDKGERGETKVFWAVNADGAVETIPTEAPEFKRLTKDEYGELSEEERKKVYPEVIVNSLDEHKELVKSTSGENVQITLEDSTVERESRIKFDEGDSHKDKIKKYVEFAVDEHMHDTAQFTRVGIQLLEEVL